MRYFGKKTVTLIMTLFLVSVAAFLAFQIIPGDVVGSILGTEATPEREAQLREELGLNDPPVVRYVNWMTGVLRGDLGRSYRYSKSMNEMMPVAELIGDKLPVTLWLAVLSVLLIVIVSIPLGVFWAKSRGRAADAFFSVLTQTTMAVPSFFLGILVTYLFGMVLRWFIPGGYVSYQDNFAGFLAYLIFPALSVALPKIAMTARFLRNSLLTEMSADYVRTARSKGCTEQRVMYGHVLRNALMPVVTFLGMIIAEIVAGSIVVEQVFGLPGVGRLLISSISTRDLP
ncbi:MAG: ABC transporter permease, partial [Acetatifactor sp.]|nr:ABC transporter permease [Acetatifactor sp.]